MSYKSKRPLFLSVQVQICDVIYKLSCVVQRRLLHIAVRVCNSKSAVGALMLLAAFIIVSMDCLAYSIAIHAFDFIPYATNLEVRKINFARAYNVGVSDVPSFQNGLKLHLS